MGHARPITGALSCAAWRQEIVGTNSDTVGSKSLPDQNIGKPHGRATSVDVRNWQQGVTANEESYMPCLRRIRRVLFGRRTAIGSASAPGMGDGPLSSWHEEWPRTNFEIKRSYGKRTRLTRFIPTFYTPIQELLKNILTSRELLLRTVPSIFSSQFGKY